MTFEKCAAIILMIIGNVMLSKKPFRIRKVLRIYISFMKFHKRQIDENESDDYTEYMASLTFISIVSIYSCCEMAFGSL